MKKDNYHTLKQDSGSDKEDDEENKALVLGEHSSNLGKLSNEDIGTDASQNPSPTGLSVWKLIVNITSYATGVGFLATPFAIMKGGIGSLLALCFIPCVYWYAHTIIIECLYDYDQDLGRVRARSGWKPIGEVLSPKYGGAILLFLQNFSLYFTSMSYLVGCGSLMVHILPWIPVTEVMWICFAAIIVLPTTFLKSYEELAWLSMLGIIVLAVAAGAVIYLALEEINRWDLTTLLFWDCEGFFIAIGIILYGYAYYEILPSLENSMADKNKIGMSMVFSFHIIALMKSPFSFCAFLLFGFKLDEIFVNNIPSGPFRISVVLGFIISFLLSFALPLQPIFESLENNVTLASFSSKIPYGIYYAILRICIVFLTTIGAILFPRFGLMVSFAGGVLSSVMAFIIPCFVYLKLHRHQLKMYQIISLVLLLIFGFLTFILNGIFTIKEFLQ